MVSLKRVGDGTIEGTNKGDGKVIGIFRMTVFKDGKSMQAEYNDRRRGTTANFTMLNQW